MGIDSDAPSLQIASLCWQKKKEIDKSVREQVQVVFDSIKMFDSTKFLQINHC